jgi:hypothetical protein
MPRELSYADDTATETPNAHDTVISSSDTPDANEPTPRDAGWCAAAVAAGQQSSGSCRTAS